MAKQDVTEPRAWAIKAAELITGYDYSDDRSFPTAYGNKTVKGIARMITNLYLEDATRKLDEHPITS